MKIVVGVTVLLGLAACVDTAEMGSPAYVEGWRMGCYMGYTDGGATKYWGLAYNKPTYGDSPEYQPAWEEGYRSCFDDVLSGVPAWRTLPASGWPRSAEGESAAVVDAAPNASGDW